MIENYYGSSSQHQLLYLSHRLVALLSALVHLESSWQSCETEKVRGTLEIMAWKLTVCSRGTEATWGRSRAGEELMVLTRSLSEDK